MAQQQELSLLDFQAFYRSDITIYYANHIKFAGQEMRRGEGKILPGTAKYVVKVQ